MTGLRSEANAVGNTKYPDLNMTHYPGKIDTKTQGTSGYNVNLRGFYNAGDANIPSGKEPDYNMAEHVNALADAVMALQRILGANPHVDFKGGNTSGTVSTRIAAAEDKDLYYDARYGGDGWSPALGQTLLTHTHGGGTEEAPKINLQGEVTGKLAKSFLDLSMTTGVTGADIHFSPTSSKKISEAINDKLSVSNGGIVEGPVWARGSLMTRMHRDFVSYDFSNGTSITDYSSSTGSVKRYEQKAFVMMLDRIIPDMLCNKYVVGIRLRTNSLAAEDVVEIVMENKSDRDVFTNGKYVTEQGPGSLYSVKIKGSDFEEVNKWQMFYLVGNVDRWASYTINKVKVYKLTTNSTFRIDVDNLYITPAHPAILDK